MKEFAASLGPRYEIVEVDEALDIGAEAEVLDGPRLRRPSSRSAPQTSLPPLRKNQPRLPPGKATVEIDNSHRNLQAANTKIRVTALNKIHGEVCKLRTKIATVFRLLHAQLFEFHNN